MKTKNDMYIPKVSIIIPIYNGKNYMREAIDSALGQTYKNIEIIVVNDGSTDETEEIAKSYGDKIKYYSKENGGVATALNLGISKMTGEYFSWLSHDDIYYSNKIEEDIKFIRQHRNENIITFTNFDIIDEHSEIKTSYIWNNFYKSTQWEYALLRGYLNGDAMLLPKSAFDKYGNFNEKLRAIQDYELFYRLMKYYKFVHLPIVTSALRQHSKQVTNTSKRVLSEGNPYWIKMAVDLDVDIKIKLEGSVQNFYRKMGEFLMDTPYKKAAKKLIKKSKKSRCQDKKLGTYNS